MTNPANVFQNFFSVGETIDLLLNIDSCIFFKLMEVFLRTNYIERGRVSDQGENNQKESFLDTSRGQIYFGVSLSRYIRLVIFKNTVPDCCALGR